MCLAIDCWEMRSTWMCFVMKILPLGVFIVMEKKKWDFGVSLSFHFSFILFYFWLAFKGSKWIETKEFTNWPV